VARVLARVAEQPERHGDGDEVERLDEAEQRPPAGIDHQPPDEGRRDAGVDQAQTESDAVEKQLLDVHCPIAITATVCSDTPRMTSSTIPAAVYAGTSEGAAASVAVEAVERPSARRSPRGAAIGAGPAPAIRGAGLLLLSPQRRQAAGLLQQRVERCAIGHSGIPGAQRLQRFGVILLRFLRPGLSGE